MTSPTSLYHLIPAEDLHICQSKNNVYYPKTYEQDGFTHLTGKPELLLDVANHFYQGSKGDWVLLVLNPHKLDSEVKFEEAAAVGGTAAKTVKPGEKPEVFPHLYGGINLDAIASELPVQRDHDGRFISIQGL